VGVIDTARDMMSEAARDSISKVARDMMSEVMEPMMKSMVPMLDDKRLVREIYSAVAEAPFQKTSDKLAISISDKTGDPVGEICTVLAQEIARQQLKQDEKGRVGFGSMPVEEY